jgi:hypothetical protein
MDEVPKKKIVSVYFSPALFSPLFTHDMEMQALVFLRTLHFREIWFGTVQFSASYTNLGQPHIFKHQV